MIEFTEEELSKVKKELRSTLDSMFEGDPTSMDVELAGPDYFDLAPTEVKLIQGMLIKIAVMLYQKNVVKADV